MRQRTISLHNEAETTGVLALILTGGATRPDYALYLRNLLPAYQEMEQALWRHRFRPGFGFLARRSLHRSASILADLDDLAGSRWSETLPLLPEADRYAKRIAWAGNADAGLLIAHAYTRYLGDLSGGQILRRCLLRLFGTACGGTAFTVFSAIPSLPAFVTEFRAALDEAGRSVLDSDRVVEETAVAFQMNIRVSVEVASFSGYTR